MNGPEEVAIGEAQALLDEVVQRIVETAHPKRIILFGSMARGTTGPDSDLDLLVVMPEGTHRRDTATKIYRSLRGLGIPKDIVVVTEQDVNEYRQNPSLVVKPALDEGKQIYGSV
jgi:uncharacterized protein